MNPLRTPIRALLLLACWHAAAQTTPPPAPAAVAAKQKPKAVKPAEAPAYNTNLVVIDPGHGGADNGARLAENSFEKDATIALAQKLRTQLAARGFTVVLTHEGAADETTADQRIEIANRNKPVACLLLHASNAGHGVHLYTSSLTPPHASNPSDDKGIAAWDTAQGSALSQSVRLVNDMASALNGNRVPLVVGQSSVRPIDSMTCPAVVLELSPLNPSGGLQIPASDSGYQDRISTAVTVALIFWRGHVVSGSIAQQAAQTASPTPAEAKPLPKPKAKPVIVKPPVEVPDEVTPDTTKPKPVAPKPAPPAAAQNPGGAR